MSSKPSKTAVKAQAKAEFLAASKRTYKNRVTGGLNAYYADVLPEETPMPDWDVIQDLQEETLETASAKLSLADQARREAVSVRRKRYEEGQALALANRRDLLALKNRFTSVYGSAVVTDLGLDKPLESTPFAVSLQKKHVRDKLSSPALRLGEPQTGFVALDPAQIAADMAPSIQELDAVVEVINDTRKAADEALMAKNEALADLRLRIVNVGRQMEAQYRLVGLDDVADRLRLTVRSRRNANTSAPEPDDGEPPSGEEPASQEPASNEVPTGISVEP